MFAILSITFFRTRSKNFNLEFILDKPHLRFNIISVNYFANKITCQQEVLSIILISSHFTLENWLYGKTKILCIGRWKVFIQTRARWGMILDTHWMEINNSSLEINTREETPTHRINQSTLLFFTVQWTSRSSCFLELKYHIIMMRKIDETTTDVHTTF